MSTLLVVEKNQPEAQTDLAKEDVWMGGVGNNFGVELGHALQGPLHSAVVDLQGRDDLS